MREKIKTKAIVIQKYPFQESSFICYIFSEDFGKGKFLLRGATRNQNKLGNNYQLGSIIELDTYYDNRKEWLKTYQNHLLLEKTPSEYKNFCLLFFILEFLFCSSFEESQSEKIFFEYKKFYNKINAPEGEMFFSFLDFFSQLIQMIGFYPNFEKCFFCKKKTFLQKEEGEMLFRKENYSLDIPKATIVCSNCQLEGSNLNAANIKLFFLLKKKYINIQEKKEKLSLEENIEKIPLDLMLQNLFLLFDSYFYHYKMQLKSLQELIKVLKK